MLGWFQLVNKKKNRMIQMRRYMHQYPEPSFEETWTRNYILNQLNHLNCGIVSPVGRNGIEAAFKGKENGPTIVFRADFDALPVQELNDVPYKSENDGFIHACGHDGHTATLLGVAEIVHEHRHLLKRNAVFIFQHGGGVMPGGSQEMIDDNCLNDVDKIYGTHLWSGYPTGTTYSRPGAIMASPDEFSIAIKDKEGHGARPHEAIDPIVIMAEFMLSTRKIISRTINPIKEVVLIFGMVQAGSSDSVIPDSTFCRGTIRTFDTELQAHIQEKMDKLLQGLALANDITYDMECIGGYLPVHNHEATYKTIKQAASELHLRLNKSELMMIGEDFSHHLKVRPGVFLLTGCGNADRGIIAPHHNPHFDIDEVVFEYTASEFLKILELENVF